MVFLRTSVKIICKCQSWAFFDPFFKFWQVFNRNFNVKIPVKNNFNFLKHSNILTEILTLNYLLKCWNAFKKDEVYLNRNFNVKIPAKKQILHFLRGLLLFSRYFNVKIPVENNFIFLKSIPTFYQEF